jgi:hypothetical protein
VARPALLAPRGVAGRPGRQALVFCWVCSFSDAETSLRASQRWQIHNCTWTPPVCSVISQ